ADGGPGGGGRGAEAAPGPPGPPSPRIGSSSTRARLGEGLCARTADARIPKAAMKMTAVNTRPVRAQSMAGANDTAAHEGGKRPRAARLSEAADELRRMAAGSLEGVPVETSVVFGEPPSRSAAKRRASTPTRWGWALRPEPLA